MSLEYDISDFLIFCYNLIGKHGERKKIELPRCPFEEISFSVWEGGGTVHQIGFNTVILDYFSGMSELEQH